MNRRLQDPGTYQSNKLPEVIEEYLEHGHVNCVAFNRHGTLLAAGTAEGEVVIWDFGTRGVATILKHGTSGEAAAGASDGGVCSLSWSRDGRHLLAGGPGHQLVLWDVLAQMPASQVELPAQVKHVALTARPPYLALATLVDAAPILVNTSTGSMHVLSSFVPDTSTIGNVGHHQLVAAQVPAASAVFTKDSSIVLLAQAKGAITVYDTHTRNVLDVVRIPGAPKILGMVLDSKGSLLIVNCHDRALRMFSITPRDIEMVEWVVPDVPSAIAAATGGMKEAPKGGSLLRRPHEALLQSAGTTFRNAVERTAWCGVAFTSDREHVIGAAAHKTEHNLYIWDRATSKLEKILEGPRGEGILDIAAHPLSPMMVSVSTLGTVYIWSHVHSEPWSAFAPDFTELYENEEYIEAEDEFDANPKARMANSMILGEEEEEEEDEVDVLTKDEWRLLSSDDETDTVNVLQYMPVVLQAKVDVQDAGDLEQEQRAPIGTDAMETMFETGSEAPVQHAPTHLPADTSMQQELGRIDDSAYQGPISLPMSAVNHNTSFAHGGPSFQLAGAPQPQQNELGLMETHHAGLQQLHPNGSYGVHGLDNAVFNLENEQSTYLAAYADGVAPYDGQDTDRQAATESPFGRHNNSDWGNPIA